MEKSGKLLNNLPGARVLANGEDSDSAIKVNMVTLGSLVEQLGIDRVNFIKCDIEGFELPFFKGGRSILTRDRPAIICEIEQKRTARFRYTPDDLFSLLRSLGYQSFIYTSNGFVPIEGITPFTINYIFLHKSAKSPLKIVNMKGVVSCL